MAMIKERIFNCTDDNDELEFQLNSTQCFIEILNSTNYELIRDLDCCF